MAAGRAEFVKIQSSDGEVFDVPIKVAMVSRTLSVMLTDLGHQPDDLIPLPNVNSSILRKVLGWAEHSIERGLEENQQSVEQPPPSQLPPAATSTTVAMPSPPATPTSGQMPMQPRPQPRVPQRPSTRRLLPPPSHTLSTWETEFLIRNKGSIYDLLLAANYLDIKSLQDALCKVVADMIKGRDPQDIRKVFHAPNPLGNWRAAQGDRLSFISNTSTTTSSSSSSNVAATQEGSNSSEQQSSQQQQHSEP